MLRGHLALSRAPFHLDETLIGLRRQHFHCRAPLLARPPALARHRRRSFPSPLSLAGWWDSFLDVLMSHRQPDDDCDEIPFAIWMRTTTIFFFAGFPRKEFRGKLAIAITANFVNNNTTAEAVVEEISGVAFVYKQDFFNALYDELGIALENIVYYKDETHYFVMTTKKHSLLARDVLRKVR